MNSLLDLRDFALHYGLRFGLPLLGLGYALCLIAGEMREVAASAGL